MRAIILMVIFFMIPGHVMAKTWGLVVGINKYAHERDLYGAENDARDIADALKKNGAEKVILLLNEKATYAAITGAWKQLVNAASPGDAIVFSYAGHGGREPEHIKNSEADHKDEAFILSGFQKHGPGAGERIIDNEINQWFSNSPQLNIIFVADSCYSGTMTRSMDFRSNPLGGRSIGDYGAIENDPHPPVPVNAALIKPHDLPNVIFLASSLENERTPELIIERQPRGALSWAFARALRGAADKNNDNILTKGELEQYIKNNILMLSQGRQHPHFLPRGNSQKPLFSAPSFEIRDISLPDLMVRIIPENAETTAMTGKLKGILKADNDSTADLVWDRNKNQVINGLGDVVSMTCKSLKDFQKIIDKWRFVGAAFRLCEKSGLRLKLSQGDKAYKPKDEIILYVTGHRYAYFTMFSINPKGKAEFIYPLQNRNFNDPLKIDKNKNFRLDLEITEPFGAEHILAIATPKPLSGLHKILSAVNPDIMAVFAELKKIYANRSFQAGIIGVYSAP